MVLFGALSCFALKVCMLISEQNIKFFYLRSAEPLCDCLICRNIIVVIYLKSFLKNKTLTSYPGQKGLH